MAADDSMQMEGILQHHTHAIIDWMHVVPDVWHEELQVHPLVPRYFRGTDDDIMPVLLTLDTLSEAHRKLLCANLEDAKDRPDRLMLACLLRAEPNVSHSSLAFHLTKMLMLDGQGRKGVDQLFRYYHIGMFLQMLRIFRPAQMRQFFGPVQAYAFQFQREWVPFTPPEVTTDVVIPRYWFVNEAQEQKIACVGLINKVLIRWKEKTGLRWESVESFHAHAEKVEQILIFSVQRYQLRDFNDQLLFAEHSLLYGEHFHEHPKIQPLLQATQEKGWGYAGDCADITEDDWKAISAFSAARQGLQTNG